MRLSSRDTAKERLLVEYVKDMGGMYIVNPYSYFNVARRFFNPAAHGALVNDYVPKLFVVRELVVRNNDFKVVFTDMKESCVLSKQKAERIALKRQINLDIMVKCNVLEYVDMKKINACLHGTLSDMDVRFSIPANELVPYNQLMRKPEWESLRERLITSRGGKCEVCGSTSNLQVHHISYKYGNAPWEYPDDNFLVLCKKCHEKVHGRLF